MRNMSKRIKGQGMTEYIIIVALIAIAAIGAFTLFGKTARNQVAAMASELGGEPGDDAITEANNAGKAAVTTAKKEVNLSNYNETATEGGKSGGG
ncbi:pilus assembly protein [uncultured Gilvimarinus sp.]|uniref:pilus assembly protein n=1 Tax=uncultured Gilvimarinus sp. TaxID=1689143 RepID=UPI0030ED1AFD|tara:strand:- start:13612 stop:13896 length:285 start_codon:yes stop_codon:yes gene_type:complete